MVDSVNRLVMEAILKAFGVLSKVMQQARHFSLFLEAERTREALGQC